MQESPSHKNSNIQTNIFENKLVNTLSRFNLAISQLKYFAKGLN